MQPRTRLMLPGKAPRVTKLSIEKYEKWNPLSNIDNHDPSFLGNQIQVPRLEVLWLTVQSERTVFNRKDANLDVMLQLKFLHPCAIVAHEHEGIAHHHSSA